MVQPDPNPSLEHQVEETTVHRAADPVTPVAPQRPRTRTVTVPVVSLPVELLKASLGAFGVGISAFVSNLALTNITQVKALETAALAGGLVAATFFSNSFNNWYQQKYGA